MVPFHMTLLKSEQIVSWMMNEFIHWPKPYLFLSTTCDEISSRMIEILILKIIKIRLFLILY